MRPIRMYALLVVASTGACTLETSLEPKPEPEPIVQSLSIDSGETKVQQVQATVGRFDQPGPATTIDVELEATEAVEPAQPAHTIVTYARAGMSDAKDVDTVE